ncbi:tropomodulin-2-like, partial [Anneissia japonica]|uniref:tropomodulin-2-like n=1 Tax=Anneissia japonica TaxID=1529436 RepID=UPI001425AD35
MEPENNLDVDKALKQVQENDPELTSLNMNNIKNIPIPTLISLSEALHKNTHLKTLSMASTDLTDRIAKALGEAIEANTALTCLNLESNFITGTGIQAIMKALLNNETLSELRIANQ